MGGEAPAKRGGNCGGGHSGDRVVRARHRAQPPERLSDDARDLHLRHADALADLRLRQILLEAQSEHLALARRDGPQERGERGPVLGEGEAALVGPDGVAKGVARVVVGAAR
jgi:hypothetical protein